VNTPITEQPSIWALSTSEECRYWNAVSRVGQDESKVSIVDSQHTHKAYQRDKDRLWRYIEADDDKEE
jgi:hypothetical protein